MYFTCICVWHFAILCFALQLDKQLLRDRFGRSRSSSLHSNMKLDSLIQSFSRLAWSNRLMVSIRKHIVYYTVIFKKKISVHSLLRPLSTLLFWALKLSSICRQWWWTHHQKRFQNPRNCNNLYWDLRNAIILIRQCMPLELQ